MTGTMQVLSDSMQLDLPGITNEFPVHSAVKLMVPHSSEIKGENALKLNAISVFPMVIRITDEQYNIPNAVYAYNMQQFIICRQKMTSKTT